jgi:hypothetical protein
MESEGENDGAGEQEEEAWAASVEREHLSEIIEEAVYAKLGLNF